MIAAPARPPVFLRLSDLPQVECDGAAPLPLAPRDAALLAWLALEGPTSRDRLAALLWPTSSPAQGRTALRQRLFQLKKALDADIAAGSPVLALAEGVKHDLGEAVELLGTLGLPDAPEFDAWLTQQRQQRQQREADSLQAQAQALEDAGDAAAALPVAQALLRREPLSEVAHQRVIRLLYLTGDRAAALAAFDACEHLLKHELGARPAPETLALLATVERTSAPMAAGARRALPAAVLRPPRMVGRDHEAAALAHAWAGAQVAAVIGEAGMGKTRLLAEFMDTQPGVVRAAGRPGDAGVPFATLARLLRAIDGQPAALLGADTRNQLARVLPELGGAGATFPEGQWLHLQRAMRAYLQAAPGLQGLVLDDLHFADTASLEMLQSLIVDARQPLWALAWRLAEAGSPVHALEQALAEAAMLVPVVVAPLTEAVLAELVDELQLGIEGRAIAAQLLQRTGGNPLFVLETLKQAWVDQRIDELARGGSLPRPQSVGQLMERRVAQLSAPALALARVASIAGEDFSIGLAEAVLDTSAVQLADALNELESAQVMRGTAFAHDLVFDAVRASVPQAIAQHAHGRVAGWLERQEGEPARIARHLVEAGQPAQALPWLTRAAESAGRGLRNLERLGFLDQRAGIEESTGERDAAFETRIEALQVHADISLDSDGCEQRLEALHKLADGRARHIRVWIECARLSSRRTETQKAESFARQALEAARQLGEVDLIRRSQLSLFEVLTLAGRIRDALTLGEACLDWIDGFPDEAWRRDFHGAMAVAYDNDAQPANAVAQAELARLICERMGDIVNLSVVLGNLAVSEGERGHSDRAVSMGLESLRIVAPLQASAPIQSIGHANLAGACAQLGQFRAALRWAEKAEAELSRSAPGEAQLVRVHRAEIFWMLGQRSRCAQLLKQVHASTDSGPLSRARAHLIACMATRDDGGQTQPHIDAGLALLQSTSRYGLRESLLIENALNLPAVTALQVLSEIADGALRRGYEGHALQAYIACAQMALQVDPALAREHALQSLELGQTVGGISYRGELWLHCARALQAAGDLERAAAVLAEGQAWVRTTAAEHVPDEFRESFLHRNPTNAALLAMVITQPA